MKIVKTKGNKDDGDTSSQGASEFEDTPVQSTYNMDAVKLDHKIDKGLRAKGSLKQNAVKEVNEELESSPLLRGSHKKKDNEDNESVETTVKTLP